MLDAALLAAAQAVEHYEITRYGTLIAWAEELGKGAVAKLLTTTLNEEKAADKKLTGIAEKRSTSRRRADRLIKGGGPHECQRRTHEIAMDADGIAPKARRLKRICGAIR